MRRFAVASIIATLVAVPALAASGHPHEHHSQESHSEMAPVPPCLPPCGGQSRTAAEPAPAEPAAVSPGRNLKAGEPEPAEPATAVLDEAIETSEPEPASN